MGANIFCFKHFSVEQDNCAMKVGTDGVLLGAWCKVGSTPNVILDIGTGTGLIAMMLAQRTENFTGPCGERTTIEAVEIDPAACKTARRNFEASGWNDRLTLHCADAQQLTGRVRFDHIVSNPPFFMDSLASPDRSRNTARHAGQLTYEALIGLSDRLLRPDGRISLILPAGVETQKMVMLAGARGFVVSRRLDVHSTPKSGPKRSLIEFSRIKMANIAANKDEILDTEPDFLVIQDAGPGSFSAEYRALTRDFYLDF